MTPAKIWQSLEMISLSSSAVSEILRLKSRKHGAGELFRMGVQQTGCLGMSYIMKFDPTVQPDDQVYVCSGVQVVIDAASLPYLSGLTVDYSEDLMGGGFRFGNPNASQSCSCGNSFSVSG